MNNELEKTEDKKLKELLGVLGGMNAPSGLDNKIMQAVERKHNRQLAAQKNLKRAMIGVGITIVLILIFLLSTSGFFGQTSSDPNNQIFIYTLIGTGLVFLFVEIELLIQHFARKSK